MEHVRKKTIHIEVQRLTTTTNVRGISYYELNLVKKLSMRNKFNYELSFFDYNKERGNRAVIEARLNDVKDNIRICECNLLSYKDIMKSSVEGDLSIFQGRKYGELPEIDSRADLFHFMNSNLFPLNAPDNSIITVHDCMAYMSHSKDHFSESFQAAYINCQRIIEKNKHITVIADSESTKKDLMENFDVEDERVYVVPLGVDRDFFFTVKDRTVLNKYNITKPYFFYVGAIEKRKGVFDCVKAFRQFHDKCKDYQMVIAGGVGTGDKSKYAEKMEGEDVLYIGYVSDEDKRALLSQAELFIFPSRYEGFGLPVLEAMSCGCPVITTNISSLPEVGGDVVEYVEPESVEELAFVINKLIDDEKKRRDMSKLGKNRARIFSWERCAEATENVYSNVLRSVT